MSKFFISFLLLFLSLWVKGQTLFTEPSMTFIQKPTETITDLAFYNQTIDSVQNSINSTRIKYPNNIIRIYLSGVYTIKSAPLTLSNQMQLFLNNATIQATSTTTATALIQIANAQFISINSIKNGILEGGKNKVTGIKVTNSGKTHIDNITIQNCNNSGISFLGRGDTTYADASSVTRCTIQNCSPIALTYSLAYNFICTDNSIKNATTGIHVNGNNSVLSNNNITKCTTAIESVSQYEVFTYNKIDSCTTAFSLTNASNETIVANNKVINNTIGFNVNGNKARIYNNDCNNISELAGAGTANHLFANKGITATEGDNSGCLYFNPPLIGNQHSDIIKVGKGRYDITIRDTSLKSIRSIVDNAHNTKQNAVVVVHLNGNFNTTSPFDSLLIYDDECYLLNGTINGKDSCGTVLCFKDNLTSSFSGGTINGNNIDGKNALIYVTGNANVVLDSISVLNAAKEGITKRNSNAATYLRGCFIDNSNYRNVWLLASSRLFAFENKSTNSTYDGFDLDAFSSYAVVQNNYSCSNKRHGVFLEEGANNHIVLGNILDSNANGVSFYNMEVNNKNTSKNLIAENSCRYNSRSINMNALAYLKATINNTLFNNVCTNSTDVGIGGFYSDTTTYNNYTALNIIANNTNGPYYSKIRYTANYFWNTIPNQKVLPVKFISFNGTKINGNVVLKWKINSDAQLFDIQKSIDCLNFYSIGNIHNLNIQNQEKDYSFIDTKSFQEKAYYRIKCIDKSGLEYYSDNQLINNHNAIALNCFSLSHQLIKVLASSPTLFKTVGIKLLDVNGKTFFEQHYSQLNSFEFNKSIEIPSLNKGIYIVIFKTENGEFVKKVIL